jgi:hypothetical protein
MFPIALVCPFIRATAYIERKQKAQSKIDKPEQLAT